MKVFLWTLPLIVSCSHEEDRSLPATWQAFIVCEGNFNSDNSSLTLLDTLQSDTTFRKAYEVVNDGGLGDFAHGMVVAGTRGYIAVTGSDRIEVIDMATLESIGPIEGIDSPRHLVTDGSLLWVTSYSDSAVYCVSLMTETIVQSYRLGHRPDEIAHYNDFLFISNASTGDSAISIITLSDQSVQRVTVGRNPVSLDVMPRRSEIFVACQGAGTIVVLDASSHVVMRTLASGIAPVKVVCGDPYVAYIRSENGDVTIYNTDTDESRSTSAGNFHGIAFGGMDLFALDARDFVGRGEVQWMSPALTVKRIFSTDTAPVHMTFMP